MTGISRSALAAVLAQSSPLAPLRLYGYFRNPCIHESAAALVSLHATKAGAWRAKHAAMFAAAVEEREFHLRVGGWLRGRKTLEDSAYFIQPIEVLP